MKNKMSDKLDPDYRPEPLSKEQFKMALPKKSRVKLTDETMSNINNVLLNSEMREEFRDNLMTYTTVLTEGKFSVQQYVSAIKYVTAKLLGATNFRAWTMTFPERYQHYLDKGVPEKDIASVVRAYNSGILVNKIMEQTLIPSHILNADIYQDAINNLATLMINAKSDFVKVNAASKLVDALRMPETSKIELDVNVSEDHSITELRQTTLELVEKQKLMLKSGAMSAKDVAHSKLVHTIDSDSGEIIDNDD